MAVPGHTNEARNAVGISGLFSGPLVPSSGFSGVFVPLWAFAALVVLAEFLRNFNGFNGAPGRVRMPEP